MNNSSKHCYWTSNKQLKATLIVPCKLRKSLKRLWLLKIWEAQKENLPKLRRGKLIWLSNKAELITSGLSLSCLVALSNKEIRRKEPHLSWVKKNIRLVKVSLSSLHHRLHRRSNFNTKTLPRHLLVMITFKFLESCVAPDLKLQCKILMVVYRNPEREVSV